MDRPNWLVTVVVLGQRITTLVVGANNEAEARDIATTNISKSFRIEAATPTPAKRRTSLWDTYVDGFKVFASKFTR